MKSLLRRMARLVRPGFETDRYWEERYAAGGDSGAGTEGANFEFKRDHIEQLIREHGFTRVVDFGCGDGRQMYDVVSRLAESAKALEYHGIDVSESAVARCRRMYRNRSGCRFDTAAQARVERYDLAMSIDVIYHVVEYDRYVDYLKTLFGCAGHVLIYANREPRPSDVEHVVFRDNLAEIDKLGLSVELIDETPHPTKSTSFFLFRVDR